jgi:hypothetical protein
MKSVSYFLAAVCTLALTARAQFNPGNLAVFRVGDGVQTLANTGNSVFVDQYTTAGSFVNSVAIPTSGGSALIVSGTASSEGALALSADGRFLTLAGYNTARPFSSDLTATTAATVHRGIGLLDASGAYTLAASTSSGISGANVRSGVTDGAGNYWAGGGAGGTFYVGNNAAAGAVQNTAANSRVLNIINGSLYFSTGSGTPGIYGFTGTPTSTATASLLIGTGTGSSPYGFAINPAATVAYVADDRSSGGIQRYDKTGGTWGLTYTLDSGTGVRGLSVSFAGPNSVVYATTTGNSHNSLIMITDSGVGSTATTLATAGANEVFRGVAFVPAPEPATWVLLLLGGGALGKSRGRNRRS